MKKRTVLLIIFSLLILLLILSPVVFFYHLTSPVETAEKEAAELKLEVPYGMSVSSVANELEKNGIIRNGKIFYICARYPKILSLFYKNYRTPSSNEAINWKEWTFTLKSGIYHISSNMSIPDILTELTSGQQEYIRISIPEGYTILKIAELLQKNNLCSKEAFITASKSPELIAEYNLPSESCEGFLFPDTYYFNAGMQPEEIAAMMLNNFFEKLTLIPELFNLWNEYKTAPSEQNKKAFYDIIVLASIIEREYKIKEEAPLIASVFANRLRHNIGLYSCATIEYIIADIQGKPHPDRILIEDTKIESPYNTYKYAGLPPGAISNPGLTALTAATSPAKTNYYYFQLIDGEDGRHVFSTTFQEHKENHNYLLKK